MRSMFVTLAVFQRDMSALKSENPLNALAIFVTRETSQYRMSPNCVPSQIPSSGRSTKQSSINGIKVESVMCSAGGGGGGGSYLYSHILAGPSE
ncbi:unnamed protein product [Bathycoccus prasinos]